MATTKYIALLRGINVGGNNKIAMPELRAAFERQGFTNVVSYINSGNILFDSELDEAAVKAACEKLIVDEFGLNILVGIVPADELIEAMANAPDWWDNDPESKHNLIYVIPPLTAAAAIAEIGDAMPEHERIGYHGRMIFWSANLAKFSHTRWSKVVYTKSVYNAITIRNANTAKKLAQLATG
jgi:uncharacterized protein (DUF1697 family)